jgi:Uma2 family endonuclease
MSTAILTAKKTFLLQRWQQILNDPELDQYDDDYRIETDAEGHVLMSPRPPNTHNRKAFQIAYMLQERLGPSASGETRILTDNGIKVADAVWCPDSRWPQNEENDTFLTAPDICIEVLSASNTRFEIDQKRALYFAAGASEVWVCERNNKISFYGPEGLWKRSKLCPDFPSRLEITPHKPRP